MTGRRDAAWASEDLAVVSVAMGDEAAQLLEASTLPWEDRFVHKFWKARVAAYEAVVKEYSLHATVEDSDCLKAFGALQWEPVSPRHLIDTNQTTRVRSRHFDPSSANEPNFS